VSDLSHIPAPFELPDFDTAADALGTYMGLSREYKQRTNSATFIGDVHIAYRREVKEGDRLRFTGRIIACDAKRVHYWLEMFHADEGYLAATAEFLELHIDMNIRRVAPMPDEVLKRIEAVRDAHAILPLPEGLGKVIRVPNGASPVAGSRAAD
jgi:acyl-CoA thioester hydrolase